MVPQAEEQQGVARAPRVAAWAWWGAKALGVCCLPLFLITFNLLLVTNSSWLYEYGFSTYNIPAATGIAYDQLLLAAKQTRDYFNSSDEPLQVTVVKNDKPFELYKGREVLHMADVKELLLLAKRIAALSGAYLLALALLGLWLRRRAFVPEAAAVLLRGSVLTLGLMFLAALGTFMRFDQLFLVFHLISFTNNLWLLDPTRDYLLMMYPDGFFRDATLVIAALTLAEAGALVMLSAKGLFGASEPADS